MGTLETGTPPAVRPRERDTAGGGGYGESTHVIVLNDDHNTFEHVAATLARHIPGVDYARGMQLANTIHSAGKARVWSGHREIAELYWDQLSGAGLTMAPLA
ncbi:MAG: ATP-dependent Clp protease adaptor ClpS [Thermoleophilia bacterium]|nr:ATP-dependent Clp protease adaptor ClpS [Thermoleophilia bacterium]